MLTLSALTAGAQSYTELRQVLAFLLSSMRKGQLEPTIFRGNTTTVGVIDDLFLLVLALCALALLPHGVALLWALMRVTSCFDPLSDCGDCHRMHARQPPNVAHGRCKRLAPQLAHAESLCVSPFGGNSCNACRADTPRPLTPPMPLVFPGLYQHNRRALPAPLLRLACTSFAGIWNHAFWVRAMIMEK